MGEIHKLPRRIRSAFTPEQAIYLAWVFEHLGDLDPDNFQSVEVERRDPAYHLVPPYWRVVVVASQSALGNDVRRVVSTHADHATASFGAYVIGCQFTLQVNGAVDFNDDGGAA